MQILVDADACPVNIADVYLRYLSAYLDVPVKRLENEHGVVITATEERSKLPKNSLLHMPLYAFCNQRALFVSCPPDLKDEVSFLLDIADIQIAFEALRSHFGDKERSKTISFGGQHGTCTSGYHQLFGLDNFSQLTDTTNAVMLSKDHYSQYYDFYFELHPSLRELSPESWLPLRFDEIEKQKNDFFLYVDGKIVSATEATITPYMNDEIIELGVNTIEGYRRKGYAFAVCSAFMKEHLQKGIVPFWRCKVDNIASQKLAEKLGFHYLGDEYLLYAMPF